MNENELFENLETVTEETVSGSSVPDQEQNEIYTSLYQAFNDAFNDVLDNHFITIEENQVSLLEFLEDYYGYSELSEEDKLKQEENEQLEQQYRDDLLDTLHNINAGVVSQNALLEENNRLLKQSISMCTVSENTVSENAIMTTKLENYSLTDSLLLIIIVILLFFSFVMLFVRKEN